MAIKIIFSEEQKNNIISLYNEGLDSHKIGKKLGLSCQPILKVLKEKNIILRDNNRYNIIDDNKIIELYKNKTIKEISNQIKRSPTYISNVLKKYNIDTSIRINFVNEEYFENINTENKAYWLGFLYADGNVSKEQYSIKLALGIKDITHLIKYKNDLNISNEIKILNGTNNNYLCSLSINSIKMCKDLIKIGCVSRKSMIIKFPELDTKLLRHFIRGYFDGDGCISIKKYALSLNFTSGNHLFLEKISEYLINRKVHRRKNFSTLDYNSFEHIQEIYNYLYSNSNIYLDRKKDKFDYLIANKNDILFKINENRRKQYKINKDYINEKRRKNYLKNKKLTDL